MIDLNEFCKKSLVVAQTRQKNGAKLSTETIQMLKHCATEVVEATEAATKYLSYKSYADFSAKTLEEKWAGFAEPDIAEVSYKKQEESFSSELADIMSCCIIIAANERIDLEKALNDCYEKNRLRSLGIGDKK